MSTSSQEVSIIQLPDVLDVRAAGPLHTEFLAKRGTPIAIDASLVQRLGAQCLQVLLSAEASWKADQMGFSIIQSSEVFDQTLVLFGAGGLGRDITGAMK